MDVVLIAVVLLFVSGTAALFLSRLPRAASALAAAGVVASSVLALGPTWQSLIRGAVQSLELPWDTTHGAFLVELDSLSAFFLLPLLVLSSLASVYGASYLLAYRDNKSLGAPWFFFNAFVASMMMVLVARTVVLFLVAWEVMSVSAYCLVTFEHEKAEARKAGWIYLVATHLGVVFVLIAFLLLGNHAGSLEFRGFETASPLTSGGTGLVFVLALVGFGTKAGFVPFHVWLPEAHPAAPSHVSALMSGVMIEMGLYGILRVLSFLNEPAAWWGVTLAGLGLFTSLVGIALSLNERDVKRVLAYSSIENMGLIALALGVGLWGWASHVPTVAVLGTMAALLHVWSHALMKGLMFFAAGGILHATGTRDMERLGGLLKKMPWTGNCMLIGAAAMAALPPLNGFLSKWLLYLGLVQCGLTTSEVPSLTALLSIGMLAIVGGLAALAFVRLAGVVLLGSPRSEAAEQAHESPPTMVATMMVMILLCMMMAAAPKSVAEMLSATLEQILAPLSRQSMLPIEAAEASLYDIGLINVWMTIAVVGAAGILLWLPRTVSQQRTWGCGYPKPTSRMQYTGRSLAQLIQEHLLPGWLRSRTARRALDGLFPTVGAFESETQDPISERLYVPFFRRLVERIVRLRILQQGAVHVYLVYIMLTVVLALAWVTLREWSWRPT